MKKEEWVGVDLDGTLAYLDVDNFDYEKIGEIIPQMKSQVLKLLDNNVKVKIFTARVSDKDIEKVTKMIQDWLEENGLPRLEVTCKKDYNCVQIWDDRARQVILNTGYLLDADLDSN